MQLAKVVIASALVLSVCAEGLPDGKQTVQVKYKQTLYFCVLLVF